MPIQDKKEMVKDLAAAVSTQAKAANRLWLALMVLTLLILLPHNPKAVNQELPFSLPSISIDLFNVVAALLLSLMVIAFCAAHEQIRRGVTLSQEILNEPGTSTFAASFRLRVFYDILIHPTFNRVAPLAWMVRGESACRRRIAAGYYLYLKLVGTTVYFVVPGIALWTAFSRLYPSNKPQGLPLWTFWLSYAAGVGAILALIQVVVAEIVYTQRVTRVIVKIRPKEEA